MQKKNQRIDHDTYILNYGANISERREKEEQIVYAISSVSFIKAALREIFSSSQKSVAVEIAAYPKF